MARTPFRVRRHDVAISMPLLDFLTPEAVAPALRAATARSRRSRSFGPGRDASPGSTSATIFEALLQRERLGSTGIGDGIAIPHGKLPKLDRLFGLVARLERPIDFEALDGQPVDLLFLLLAPEGAGADHLKALARVARVLREPGTVDRLRAARDASGTVRGADGNSTPRAA